MCLCAALCALLDLGADPTVRDDDCRPVLHAAVANLCPVDGLERLLSSPGVSIGDVGGDGSVLHALVCSIYTKLCISSNF